MAREGSVTTTVGQATSFGRKSSIIAARSGRTPWSRSACSARASFGLAGAFMRERKNPHHDAAGRPLTETREQGLERQSEHPAREELVAIDQVEQRHRLAAQRMDDVTIIDDMAMSAARLGAAAPQGENRRRALKAFEPIVMQMHPQPLADQSRGNRVKHLAQDEGAGAGDVDMDLLVVGGLAERQFL